MGIDIALEHSSYGIGGSEVSLDGDAAPNLALRSSTSLATTRAIECFQAGMECLGLGEAGEARGWFEKAISADPDFADGHVGLGVTHALEYNIYPAIDSLERAAELDPASFHAHYKLGQLYFKLRVPRKGYEGMSRALACARTLAERGLVAQLLREERQREKNDAPRPWWYKPFSPRGIALGLGLVTVLFTVAALVLR
jgi:tetratricopeptide (TPR) repeat protein